MAVTSASIKLPHHPILLQGSLQEEIQKDHYPNASIICQDGSLVQNKLIIGLLFHSLHTSSVFNLLEEVTVLLPDFTTLDIKAKIRKLFGVNSLEMFKKESKENYVDAKNNFKCEHCDETFKHIDVFLRHKNSHKVKTELKNCSAKVSENLSDLSYNSDDDAPDHCDELEETESQTLQTNSISNGRLTNNDEKNFHDDSLEIFPKRKRSARKQYSGPIYPGEFPYGCSFCDKRFKKVNYVNLHERTHTGTQKYVCPYCEKKFNQKSHLDDHVRLHTGEKPYMCSHCGKDFACGSALKSHLKVHLQDKKYKCNFCEKSFNQLCNKKTHERLHTGQQTFMCCHCGRTFNTKHNLNKHNCAKKGAERLMIAPEILY